MRSKDYYQILGVGKTATADEIRKAYRKLAMQFHPDRNAGDKGAEDRFKQINEAYAVLSDAEKRKQYDTFGADGFGKRYTQEDIFRGFDFQTIFQDMGMGGDLFESLFGGGARRPGQRGGPRVDVRWGAPFGTAGGHGATAGRGQDTTTDLRISFYESVEGGERIVQVPSPAGGFEKVSVKVPAGVSTGKTLRLRGKGAASPFGGERGDLYLRVVVEDDPVFRREGDDLRCDVKVPVSVLALGGSAEVPTLTGPRRVKVSEGTQAGMTLRLPGLGAPGTHGRRGDLYARLVPVLPTALDDRLRRLFKELSDAGF